MDVNELLNERQRTHGHFPETAGIIQHTKNWWRAQRNWSSLTPSQREALDMIAHKIGRILAGDPNHEDHWADISGYSALAEREIASSRRDYSESFDNDQFNRDIDEIMRNEPLSQAAE